MRYAPGVLRLGIGLALVLVPFTLPAQDDALPPLPPEPRPAQLIGDDPGDGQVGRGADEQRLTDEIRGLQRALRRVQAALGDGAIPSEPGRAAAASRAAPEAGIQAADGPPRVSRRFGQRLVLQMRQGGAATVSADLAGETADSLLRELAALAGARVEDPRSLLVRRSVRFAVQDVPLDEAIERLLGQAGLAIPDEAAVPGGRWGVTDARALTGAPGRLEELARRALATATRASGAAGAAEAQYLLASDDLGRHRNAEALRGFDRLITTHAPDSDPAVRVWVQRATRGAGDAMLALSAFDNARIAYRTYIARALDDDSELPQVYLAAANAARRQGESRSDPVALDESLDDLHALIERFADRPRAAAEIAAARLGIGELQFTAGSRLASAPGALSFDAASRLREAESQFTLHLAASGANPPDQIAFWLAECAFLLGRAADARPRYERLVRAWRNGGGDHRADPGIYPTSAFRIGECHIAGADPREHDHVLALFAFLRAKEEFPRSPLQAEIAIAIARCHAELERDDQTITTLLDLLRGSGGGAPQARLDRLIGELLGHLGDHPGPVRARILFHVAQAQFRHAGRDRARQGELAHQAMGSYQRVLAEDVPDELKIATRIGFARAALTAGADDEAEKAFSALLRDRSLGPRDRAYVAQLFGDHLRAAGRLRDAIRAYKGEAGE